MSIVLSIMRREVQAYFVSPIAYTVIVIFLGITGFGFLRALEAWTMAPAMAIEQFDLTIREVIVSYGVPAMNVVGLATWMDIGMVIALPALSMRLFSEERKVGTAELLMTSPITTPQLVIGKYLGTITILLVILLLTLPYVVVLGWKADPELAATASAYLGFLLHGAVILAAGLFASALTENQIVALMLTYAIFLPLWLLDLLVGFMGKPLDDLLAALSVGRGMQTLSRGLIHSHYVFLDVVLIFLFLFLCAQVIDSSRWR